MGKMARFLRPYWKETLFGALFKLMEAILELMLPYFMADLIDQGINQGDAPYIYQKAIQMLIITALGMLAALTCQFLASRAACGVATDLRSEMMDKITHFTYKELDQFGTATLTNRLTGDINLVRDAVAMLIRLVSRAPFLCIGAAVMGILINPQLSWVFVFIIPLFSLIAYVISRKSVPVFKKVQRKLDTLGLSLRENLSGVRVIRALARQETEKTKSKKATSDLAESYIKATDITSWINPITMFLMNMSIIAVLYFGAYMINAGSLLQGQLVSFVEYVVQIMLALVIVSNLVNQFTKAAAASERITQVLEMEPEFTYPAQSLSIGQVEEEKEALSFSHVSFRHGTGETVFSDISFSIPAGTVFGIIGPTGSGKSTLIHLIPRFYEASGGSILLFGRPVEEYSRENLVDLVGMVPQKSVLFSGTILDNMRATAPDATEEEVEEALRIAQAYDFVMEMPKGLRSPVDQGGKNFSGGQRQRLSIARTLVKKAPFLILDDSLSALDYQTDQRLRAALRASETKMTTVIVSQRVNSVASADQIMVLDSGQVVGLGSHETLLKTCATYREIYETQTALQGEKGVE